MAKVKELLLGRGPAADIATEVTSFAPTSPGTDTAVGSHASEKEAPSLPASPKRLAISKARSSVRRRVVQFSRQVADNKAFVAVGIVLTIWALSGDDLRLLCTDKPADRVFDGLILFLIVFFTVELIVSCHGKDDYFLGFFFGLDVVSTLTLFLDLTVVSDALFGDSGGENESDKARSSKTARAGARVGRVVRVLRLVRIVKLFKVAQGAQMRKRQPRPSASEEQYSWDDDPEEGGDGTPQVNLKESLVGKKLSARTTQRTILLVLILLIVLPLLSTDGFMRTPSSAEYGADDVLKAFDLMVQGNGTREAYEATLLKYIYYHNWFTGAGECPKEDRGCSNWFYGQLFWVGVASTGDPEALRERARQAGIRPESALAWDRRAAQQDDLYNYGAMPASALRALSSPWDTDCRARSMRHMGFSLLAEANRKQVGYSVRCPRDLRIQEQQQFTPRLMTLEEYRRGHFTFYFDLRPYVQDESRHSLIKTVFVCVVLCVASLLFSSDANALVLQPVEQMITKVEAIRDNPLAAMKMADDEFKREEIKRMKSEQGRQRRSVLDLWKTCWTRNRHELLETVILEKTIIKLGSLLALSFGEAGANIVSHNMRGSNSANVNAMIEGSRVECVVGKARIRDFSVATEVLQGKVMTFVNQVAEIVHGIVDQYHGAVNKNNGDTFLVVWRTAGMSSEQVTKMAEMSIVAFARITGAVHRSELLASYRGHPGLQQRLRRSQCRVNLSFGLHCGWAIEGAVGSEFKIDASYLSPNVSIAGSIEEATQTYEVTCLVSQAVAELCTPEMAAKLRLIDKVVIRGSKQPLQLYCLDLDYLALEVDQPMQPLHWNTQQRYHSRQLLEAEKSKKWCNFSAGEVFEACPDLVTMRRRYTVEFQRVFSMGYQNYSEGEWRVARHFLIKTRRMLGGARDGPSAALLRFMEVPHSFEAPAGWQGVHELSNVNQ